MGHGRRRRLCALIATGCVVAGCGSGESQNAQSAHAVLAASRELQETISHDAAASAAAVRQLLAHVNADCPGVLANAARDGGPLREEAFQAVELARGQVTDPARRRFARILAGLRFSDPGMTREAQEAARAYVLHAAIPTPDVCAYARAFIRAGGLSTPPGTGRLLAAQRAAEEASFTSPPLLRAPTLRTTLEQYESAAERRRREARENETLNGAPAHAFVRNAEALQRELGLRST